MVIVTLNMWAGKVGPKLRTFFQKYSATVDIFCLQEVFSSRQSVNGTDTNDQIFLEDIAEALPEFNYYFDESQSMGEGLAIFIRNTKDVTEHGNEFVYRWKNSLVENDGRTLGRNIQHLVIRENGQNYYIANFHGLWTGTGKEDTPERIQQSLKVQNIINSRGEETKILVGDFNLHPDTKSLKKIEQSMNNIVTKYEVKTTRPKSFLQLETPDYIFLSPNIVEKRFEVLDDEVSDHLALLIEI